VDDKSIGCRLGLESLVLNTAVFIMVRTVDVFVSFALLAEAFALPATRQATNPCPADTEYACFDVINSSLCLSQNASRNGTAAQMAACVDYPGGMSDLPGASKVRMLGVMMYTTDGCIVMPLSRMSLHVYKRSHLKAVSSTVLMIILGAGR
jgi:hypothetical protein